MHIPGVGPVGLPPQNPFTGGGGSTGGSGGGGSGAAGSPPTGRSYVPGGDDTFVPNPGFEVPNPGSGGGGGAGIPAPARP
ncbi:putative cell wall protein [Senna tora]|uniref:Putative cell wall protein n=1 Tax=Senna tora TaxID=362788 RepID=A0A834W1Q4_9FABA|nr:putative cell wall protein [Senna tora]